MATPAQRKFMAGKKKNEKSAKQKQAKSAQKAAQKPKKTPKGGSTGHTAKRPSEARNNAVKAPSQHGHAGFVRVECYGQRPSSNTTGQRLNTAQTYGAVLREAYREKGYHKHVNAQDTQNHPPEVLWANPDICSLGSTARVFGENLEGYLDDRLKDGYKLSYQRNRGSKKFTWREIPIPKNQAALVAGVASIPRGLWGKKGKEWTERTIKWLQKEFPDGQLKGVILHNDEAHPHVHFYAVSNEPDCDAKRLAAGFKEKKLCRDAWKIEGKQATKTNMDTAYKGGMKLFQDGYFAAVSEPIGMKRLANYGHGRLPKSHYTLTKIIERERIWNTKREDQLNKKIGKLLDSQGKLSEAWAEFNQEEEKFKNKLLSMVEDSASFKNVFTWKREVAKFKREWENKMGPWRKKLSKWASDLDVRQLDIDNQRQKISLEKKAAARVYWKAKEQIKLGLPYDVSAQKKQEEYNKLIAEQKIEIRHLQNDNDELKERVRPYDRLVNELTAAGNGDPAKGAKLVQAIQTARNYAYQRMKQQYKHDEINRKMTEAMIAGKKTPQWLKDEFYQMLAEKLVDLIKDIFDPNRHRKLDQEAEREAANLRAEYENELE